MNLEKKLGFTLLLLKNKLGFHSAIKNRVYLTMYFQMFRLSGNTWQNYISGWRLIGRIAGSEKGPLSKSILEIINSGNYQFFQKTHKRLEKKYPNSFWIIFSLVSFIFLEELRDPISFQDLLAFRYRSFLATKKPKEADSLLGLCFLFK